MLGLPGPPPSRGLDAFQLDFSCLGLPWIAPILHSFVMQAAASASAAGRQEARPEQRVGLIPWRSTESL